VAIDCKESHSGVLCIPHECSLQPVPKVLNNFETLYHILAKMACL